MRKGSIKNTRINSEVKREISAIIQNGIKDPRISPMTSVTDAKVTADLKYCTVYISVLGGEDAERKTMEGLSSATGFIRHQLAETVNLRITPEIRFVVDHSLEYGDHIDRLLNELNTKPDDSGDGSLPAGEKKHE
jgi:ribosome-binding factor A